MTDLSPGRSISSVHRLRILVAQNVAHNRRGGMSRIMGFIHDRVEMDGHDVDYFSSDQIPAHFGTLAGRLLFPFLIWRFARRATSRGRPYDLINIHEPCAYAMALLARWAGKPMVVVTSHGLEHRGWTICKEDSRLGRETIQIHSRITRPLTVVIPSDAALRRADHVFCLNEEDRHFLNTRLHVPSERVTRITPGVDEHYIDAFSRRDYGSPPEAIVWFGTWLPRKGVTDLVHAFLELSKRFAALKLLVLGAGFPESTVLDAFPLAIRERVRCYPSIKGDDLSPYVQAMLQASVYVLPSVFEGTPQTLLETMATGLPPVVTDTCGMKDVIAHEQNGLIIPTRSPGALVGAVSRLIEDRTLRERLGRRANEDVRSRYTWDQVAQPVIRVYRELASRRLGGGR